MPETVLSPDDIATSRNTATLMVLRSANGRRCAKHFIRSPENGAIGVVPYDRETHWFVEPIPCVDLGTFTQALDVLSSCTDRIIIRGALRDDVSTSPVMRRCLGAGAAFQAAARSWVALDVDGLDVGHTGPLPGVVASVLALLPARFRQVACWYQFTSSYGVNRPMSEARVRLWFMLSHPMSDQAVKRLLRPDAIACKIDLSLYNPVQPHFVASPTFQGMDDPLTDTRVGVFDPPGARPKVDVSDVENREEVDEGLALVSSLTRTGIQAHPDQVAAILERFAVRARVASRHSTAVALIGELYGHGVSGEEAVRHTQRYMIAQGRPPERGELERALTFVQRRAAEGTLRTNDTPISLLFDEEAGDVPQQPTSPEEREARREEVAELTAEWPSQPNSMARRAFADLFGGERYVRWAQQDYEWSGTYWRPFADEEELDARLQRASGATPTSCANGARALRNDHHRGFLKPPCLLVDGSAIPARIPLLNGWFAVEDIRNGRLITIRPRAHTVDIFDPVPPLPVAYEVNAQCPQFTAFLDQAFEGDPESRNTLIKLMGYLLFKGNEHQRIFICSGAPSCGKSTWLRVVRALLGPMRGAVGDLRSFSTDFGLQSVYEAQALFLPEASHGSDGARLSGESVDQLKRISGGDPVLVRRKHLPDVTAEVMPTPVVICNAPPVIRDEAFVRRLVTLHFPHSFLGREDAGLTRRLLGELPGILNLALSGLEMIGTVANPFPPPAAPVTTDGEVSPARELYEQIRTEASPVAEFARQCLELREGATLISSSDLHAGYRRWCAANHHHAMQPRQFWVSLRMALPSVRPGRERRGEGERVRGLFMGWTTEGVRFTTDVSGF